MKEWEVAVVVVLRVHDDDPALGAEAAQNLVAANMRATPSWCDTERVTSFSVAEVVGGEVKPEERWDA